MSSNLNSLKPRLEFYEYDIENYYFIDTEEKQLQAYFKDFRKRKGNNGSNKRIKVDLTKTNSEPVQSNFKSLESSIDPIVSLEDNAPNLPIEERDILNLKTYLKKYREWKTRAKLNSNKSFKILKKNNIGMNFYSESKKQQIKEAIHQASKISFDYVEEYLENEEGLKSFLSTNNITFEEFVKFLFGSNINDIEQNKINILFKYFISNIKFSRETDNIHNGAFVFNINFNISDKIICFGDFHGSFHTFIRNLFRLHLLGILDLSNGQYKINRGYRLIFLGDLIDRGNYGLDVLYILSQFIIQNNTKNDLKIIINRGNHEVEPDYNKYGFKKEYKFKLNQNKTTDLLFSKFFSFLPSAIILNHGNTRYWMCHGGIPINFEINENTMELKDKPPFNFIDTPDLKNKNILFINSNTELKIPNQIRWNDFSGKENSEINEKRKAKNGSEGIYVVGTNYLKSFLNLNKIDFIIRGHQDSYFNSFIFTNPGDKYNLSKVPLSNNIPVINSNIVETNTDINTFFHKTPKVNLEEFNLSNGAVAMIDVLNTMETTGFLKKTKTFKQIGGKTFFPVVTISTNTDNDRPLTRDSFMMIRNVNNSSNGYEKGLFNKDYILSFNLERQNNILSKVRKQYSLPNGTYSCGIVNKNKNVKNLSDENKNKYLINFYLNKGICTGLRESSRRIKFEAGNEGNVIFYSSGKESSIRKNIYNILSDSTPFVSFNIIKKLNNLSFTGDDENIIKHKIFNVLIDNIPNISGMRKLRHPFIRLYNTFMNLWGRRKSLLLKNKTINISKYVSYQKEINFLYSLYNFICFKIYYEESQSFMVNIGFIGKENQNINFIINTFMMNLENEGPNNINIINSLLGIDKNDNYIQEIFTYLQGLEKKYESFKKLNIDTLNKFESFKKLNIDTLNKFETFKKFNIDTLNKYVGGSLNRSLYSNNEIFKKNVENLVKYFITVDSQFSIDSSKHFYDIFSSTKNILGKREIFIEEVKNLSLEIPNNLNEFYKLVQNKISPNNTNYSQLQKIGVNSAFGEIFPKNTNKIIKKQKIGEAGNNNYVKHIKTMKVYKESLIHYYLYNFSLKIPNPTLQCFPSMNDVSLKIKNNFMTYEMGKIENDTLRSYIDTMNDENDIYKLLINICDILNYYQTTINFVHGDLHSNNILIERNTNKIYLIDFGFSSFNIPINYSNNNKNFNNWFLVDNTELGIFRQFDQNILYNSINNAKSIDLIILIFDIIKNFNKLNKLKNYFTQNFPIIFNINSNSGVVTNPFIAFYCYRFREILKKTENVKRLKNEFTKLNQFEPNNLRNILSGLL